MRQKETEEGMEKTLDRRHLHEPVLTTVEKERGGKRERKKRQSGGKRKEGERLV